MSADRNLLFGILALQLDFVSRDQLIEGMAVWALEKTQGLGQIFVANKAMDTDQHRLLDALVDKHIEKHGGDAEKSLSAVVALELDSSLQYELSQRLGQELTRSIQPLAVRSDSNSTYIATTLSYGETSTRGRFQILRPHAEGGLGRVSVALDCELHREVAFKEIKPDRADDNTSRTRFVLEAEITGGLEHPGIVPVYGLGAHNDGRPFYAMRFIRGDDLQKAIQLIHSGKQPPSTLELRKLLTRFLDVCRAIHYAHSRGVLHRDIKPSNVMLGKFGETLVVDWGLAKVVGRTDTSHLDLETTLRPTSASNSEPTVLGSAIGTPAYMSPEQAEGKLDTLTPASDVFSLGATLYELLTGKRPFEGENAAEVIERVRKCDFRSPREIRSWIPMPLEAICLKAMKRAPNDRYQSTEELAADLESWQADEPVTAWQEPLGDRVRRWMRKRPGIVSAGISLLFLGILSTLLVAWQQSNHARVMGSKNSELEVQRKKAEDREKMAIDAIKKFRDAVTENAELKNNPLLQPLRKKLLHEPLVFFERLREVMASDHNTSPTSTMELVSVAREHADIAFELGELEMALKVRLEAKDLLERLARNNLTDTDVREKLSSTLNAIASTYRKMDRPEEAIAMHRNALRIREELSQEFPNSMRYPALIVETQSNLANVLQDEGEDESAIELYQKAIATLEQILIKEPANIGVQSDLAHCYLNLGFVLNKGKVILSNPGEKDQAIQMLEAACHRWQELFAMDSTNEHYAASLAESHKEIARFYAPFEPSLNPNSNSFKLAVSHLQEAIAILKDLTKSNPSNFWHAQELCEAFSDMGLYQELTHDRDNAKESFEQEVTIRRKLVWLPMSSDDLRRQQSRLGMALNNIAVIELSKKRFDSARDLAIEAIRSQEEAIRLAPTITYQYRFLKNHYLNLKEAALGLTDAQLLQEANRGLQWVVQTDPKFADIESKLSNAQKSILQNSGSIDDYMLVAQHAYDTKRFQLAAMFWGHAIDNDPILSEDREAQHPYNAACASVLACSTGCIDDPPPDDIAKSKLRSKALKWLQQELERWEQALENATEEDRQIIIASLAHWESDIDLADVRNEKILELPTEEQGAWKSLWEDVKRLRGP